MDVDLVFTFALLELEVDPTSSATNPGNVSNVTELIVIPSVSSTD
jgi:hypothetical protein